MNSRMLSKSRFIILLAVLVMFTGCFGTLGTSLDKERSEIEKTITAFSKNVNFTDLDGYNKLKAQFTDPFLLGTSDDEREWFEEAIDEETQYLKAIIADGEDYSFDIQDEYFNNKFDALVDLYNSNGKNIDAPALLAGIRDLLEEMYIFFNLLYPAEKLLVLESGADEIDWSDIEEKIIEWLPHSSLTEKGFLIPAAAVSMFAHDGYNDDYNDDNEDEDQDEAAWQDYVLEKVGNQWVAEFTIEDEDDNLLGLVMKFTKEKGSWKISELHPVFPDEGFVL